MIAENFSDLLQILTFDSEPMADWQSVTYFRDENEPSQENESYNKWLFDNFQIKPVDDANIIVKKAQKKYQAEFKNWMKLFYAE